MSLPRLLRGAGRRAMSYEQHRRVHGELSVSGRRAGRDPSLIDELARSGLRGRGGGGFPLGRKLEAVRRARGAPVVVVNGCEGEPMSAKDRTLLRAVPHLVLDGALCCAQTLGATEIIIAVDELSVGTGKSVRRALAERGPSAGELGEAHVAELPPGYVSGEESSVVAFLNRGIAKPTYVPPRVSERGVAGRPTLVSNAETFAHAALIARRGATWFRQVGAPGEPGSALVTVRGCVTVPGVYEIESGCGLNPLLDAAGGLAERAQAYLFGGYAGVWVGAADVATLGLSRGGLRPVGTALGAGIIVAFPQSACAVAEITRVAAWMRAQGSGQCGPCTNGLAAIADALVATRAGDGGPATLREVRRWSAQVVGRGACGHPDGTARFVTSGLAVFAAEFDDHARYGTCEACDRRPVLATPRQASTVL